MVVAVVDYAVLLLLLLGVPVDVLVRVGVVVIAVIGMLELTDEILLVSGCCSWSRACACYVVIVDWVVTVEGSYGSHSNRMLMTWMHNLTLLLLLLHLLCNLVTILWLWPSRHVHYVFLALIKLNILVGSFARQLGVRWNLSTLDDLLIHWNPWILLNFPNHFRSGVRSTVHRNCPLFGMIRPPTTRSFLAWRRPRNSVLNCCHRSIIISFYSSRLWFDNTAVEVPACDRKDWTVDVFLIDSILCCCMFTGLFGKTWVGCICWCCANWMVMSSSSCLVTLTDLWLFDSLIALATLALWVLLMI